MSILDAKYKAVRSVTRSLAASLSAEDQMIQSCPEASSVKWHQAHSTYFFERFVLWPFLPDYRPFREELHSLFNSYSLAIEEEISEKKRYVSFSRPSLEEVLAFRTYVDEQIERLFARSVDDEAARRIVLGLNHEQLHQELLLTDIKHAFFLNPLRPSYEKVSLDDEISRTTSQFGWHDVQGGMIEIGHPLNTESPLDFYFGNETPCHNTYLEPFRIANRKVTCREYLEFMLDDGYMRPELWLSDGWEMVKLTGWDAPLYWERDPGDETGWHVFTLRGWHGLSILLNTPVCHISFFEADAFARWRGCRLPTEMEWELVASRELCAGNLLDARRLHPAATSSEGISQLFGDCWEWTASAYASYPGYRPSPDALGEYNGKFMSGHMILRGGSCVTPADHMRATYRKFYRPATRRQFTGMRLAA